MGSKRLASDLALVAEIIREAGRYARLRDLTAAEEADAVAELRELAAGRADLLAEAAGFGEGFAEGTAKVPSARLMARLCLAAGADPEAIPAWIQAGRERRVSAERRGADKAGSCSAPRSEDVSAG